jgi:hypothetical protein
MRFSVRRYRTEIVIPQDRVVGLHLPDHLPTGRAVVTILIVDSQASDDSAGADHDRQDIEWWEEFGGEPEDDALDDSGLESRLSSLETQP